jgi:hypothetical protein
LQIRITPGGRKPLRLGYSATSRNKQRNDHHKSRQQASCAHRVFSLPLASTTIASGAFGFRFQLPHRRSD